MNQPRRGEMATGPSKELACLPYGASIPIPKTVLKTIASSAASKKSNDASPVYQALVKGLSTIPTNEDFLTPVNHIQYSTFARPWKS